MKLSSLDIRKQEFTRVVRGYDKEEVDAFLQLAANQWQEIVDDLRREEDKVKELNIKLEHYQKVEEALEEALKTARDGAKQTIDNAEHKAKLIVEEAERRSVQITREAETERLDIRKDAAKYSVRQKEIVAKLRAFLMSELEILAQYESESPVNYIKLKASDVAEIMNAGESRRLPEPEQDAREDASHAAEPEGEAEYYHDDTDQHEFDEEEYDVPEEDVVTEIAERRSAAKSRQSDKTESKASKENRPPQRGSMKETEVSDEIEKIRRILEDLEK